MRPSISAPGKAESYHADEKAPFETEDGEEPTDDEKHKLRHIGEKLPVSAFLVAFVELCERFTYYGTSSPASNQPCVPTDPSQVSLVCSRTMFSARSTAVSGHESHSAHFLVTDAPQARVVVPWEWATKVRLV